MTSVRILLIAVLWLGAIMLMTLARQIAVGVPAAAALRRALLAAPAPALHAECAQSAQPGPAARPPLLLARCERSLLWHGASGWLDPCKTGELPAPLSARRYEVRLACSWRLGPFAGRLPLLRSRLFR